MVAFFDDSALLQDYNLIGFLDGRQSMSNGDGRSACADFVQCGLHESLSPYVNRTRRFIQNQNLGPLDYASGNS